MEEILHLRSNVIWWEKQAHSTCNFVGSRYFFHQRINAVWKHSDYVHVTHRLNVAQFGLVLVYMYFPVHLQFTKTARMYCMYTYSWYMYMYKSVTIIPCCNHTSWYMYLCAILTCLTHSVKKRKYTHAHKVGDNMLPWSMVNYMYMYPICVPYIKFYTWSWNCILVTKCMDILSQCICTSTQIIQTTLKVCNCELINTLQYLVVWEWNRYQLFNTRWYV